LRMILHNRLTAAAVNRFPPALALAIKDHLQHTSKAGYQVKTERWNYREIIRAFARSVREQGCQGLVTGHFHLALCEELDGSPFSILSLGDWIEQFTYGEMVDGKFRLNTFDRNEGEPT